MRKTLFGILSVICLLTVLVSCGTSVAVETLVPAEVSLGKGETIAVAKPTVNLSKFIFSSSPVSDSHPDKLERFLNGTSSSTYASLSNYVAKQIEKGLTGGLFKVVDAETTQAYSKIATSQKKTAREVFLENNIDFVLTTEITDATYNSWIEREDVVEKDKVSTRFYLNQYATFTCVCMVQDVRTMAIADVYTYSCRVPGYGSSNRTEVGRIVRTDDGEPEFTVSSSMLVDDALDLLKECAGDLQENIRNRLLPHYKTTFVDLKKDETKDKVLSNAYKLADKGNYEEALYLFENNYRQTGYEVAGYNAAAIYYALGQVEQAKNLAREVFRKTGLADAVNLVNRIENSEKAAQDALNQVKGLYKKGSSELIGF